MPYVTALRRVVLDTLLEPVIAEVEYGPTFTEGDLNYIFTKLAMAALPDDLNYAALNSVVGVFESAKAEFQRRVVAPFEDKKREANGDVYV